MRPFAKLLALPLIVLGLFLTAGAVRAGDVDRTDAAATAKAFLAAYKAQDTGAMALLANGKNRAFFQELAEQGEAHPGWGEVFGGWRWEAAQAASGEVGTPRYRKNGEALVPFHDMGDEIAVIALTREDGIWSLEDINSPSKERFETFSEVPPK